MFTTPHKKVVISVINDLVTDVRVKKTCDTFTKLGYEVFLIGRELNGSSQIPKEWTYATSRMKLVFTSGVPFYFFFQVRLFFKLLFLKCDLLFSNDLDTLFPNYLVSKIKGVPLIYDSHELFCEVPELQHTKLKKKIWQTLEGWIVPKLSCAITVNRSIADHFKKLYDTEFVVLRNIPPTAEVKADLSRAQLGLPEHQKIVIMQGAGINIQRGAEELIQAMQYLDDVLLLIIGSGDVWDDLKKMVSSLKLEDKVRMMSKLPKRELMSYTRVCDLGISIDKGTNLNYRYSLPNKVFDYIHSELPIMASRMEEVEQLIKEYDLGDFIDSHEPRHMAQKMKEMLSSSKYTVWKENAARAKKVLTWEEEQKVLIKLVESIRF